MKYKCEDCQDGELTVTGLICSLCNQEGKDGSVDEILKATKLQPPPSTQPPREDLSATPDLGIELCGTTCKGQRIHTLERENNQLRVLLKKYEDLVAACRSSVVAACSEYHNVGDYIAQIEKQLSDEQAARTEITRQYHDECAKLAEDLKEAQANCVRIKEQSELAADIDAATERKLHEELTAAQARLAEAIKLIQQSFTELNEIRARDGVPYTHQGIKAAVDENYFSTVVEGLSIFLSSTEPPAISAPPRSLENLRVERLQQSVDALASIVESQDGIIRTLESRAESAEAAAEKGKTDLLKALVFTRNALRDCRSPLNCTAYLREAQEAIDAAMKQTK